SYWIYVFGRLRPGADLEQSTAALNVLYSSIVNDVEAPLQTGMSDQTMERFRAKTITAEDGRRGQSTVHREARTPLLLLLATAGIVLLIACANIANLLLARGANRGLEMAVRLSLGASRAQVLRQLLSESVLLAALGGISSLAVARATLGGIGSILPPEAIRTISFELSVPVLLFAALLSMGTGLLFGLFPALHSTRPELVSTIRANAGNVTLTRRAARFRSLLVTAQIALSMALLITAALFLRSLTNVGREALGLQPENVVTFAISPQLNGYEPARSTILFRQLRDELAAVPGVTGVTASLVPILSGDSWGNDVSVEGFERGPDTDANSRFNEVGPGYFSTLGIPVLSGRDFTTADQAGGARVAIVNEAFARKFNLGRDAVGKRIGMGRDDELDIEIVGLVRDAKYNQVKGEVPPVFVLPWQQDTTIGALTFYVRATVPTEQVVRSIRPIMAGLDPNLPIENLKTLPQVVRENVFLDRMIGTLSSSFAALATLLAAVGLYGVLAYTVARRTREIGVRMALGADRGSVRWLVLRQVGLMLGIGGVVGIGAALALGRFAASLLYEVGGADPLAIALSTLLLAAFALAAGFIPAYRASRVDPMNALRYE
ncbi:MAG: ADOP family duplicated permease, partial [Gemmatimonadota bacterium]